MTAHVRGLLLALLVAYSVAYGQDAALPAWYTLLSTGNQTLLYNEEDETVHLLDTVAGSPCVADLGSLRGLGTPKVTKAQIWALGQTETSLAIWSEALNQFVAGKIEGG